MKAKPSVSLRGLRTFCVAAKHESFSAAGDELSITPSAVSHQIKSLEEELDQRLFERSARDLRLTSSGRSIYRRIRPHIEAIEAIVASVRTGITRATVRLSIQPFFASEYFMPRLGEFTASHPEVDIQVAASDESAESRHGDVDLTIRLYRDPPTGVDSRKIMPLRLAAAGSASFAEALRVKSGQIVSPFPIVVHESFPTAWQQWTKSTGIALPEKEKVTRLDSMIAVVRAVEQGIGAALVPVPIANQWFDQGTLVRLFDDEVTADLSYFLTWSEDRIQKAGVVDLRDWILERFAP